MNIRPASPADAAAIAHVHVATWQATYNGIVPESYLSSLTETDFAARWHGRLLDANSMAVLVAEHDSNLIGFASGGPLRVPIPPYDGELYALYLLPGMQRQGGGRKLLSSIAQVLRAQGHTHMLVWVLRDNPATNFYKRLGGTLVTEQTIDIGGVPLPELAFGWPLTHPELSVPTHLPQEVG